MATKMSEPTRIENSDELQTMLASSFEFLSLPRGERIESMVPRPKCDEVWVPFNSNQWGWEVLSNVRRPNATTEARI